MKRKPSFFVAFEKIDKQEDGSIIVSGVASSEAVDSDGETITAEAMKAALPDYMKFGAIREMHQPIAAGSALKCEVDSTGVTHLEAQIFDPVTCMKIEEEVLKGFSVGGKVTSRDPLNKTTITGIRLTEISVVDRPANPEALFSLGKVEGDEPGAATMGDLRKGMWTVQDFAGVLCSIGYMAQDAAMESEYEGDSSPVPAALRDWLADGAAIFQAMASEEVAELLATLPAPPPPVEVVQMAEKLGKAGAKFGKATKEALADIHKCFQDGASKMDALGYKQDDDDEADGAEDNKKAEGVADLQKAAGLADDLQKAQDAITALTAEKETLTKRVAELEAQPAPAKGVINAVVSKSSDNTSPDSDEAKLQKQAEEIAKLPLEEQALFLIKAMHEQRRA